MTVETEKMDETHLFWLWLTIYMTCLGLAGQIKKLYEDEHGLKAVVCPCLVEEKKRRRVMYVRNYMFLSLLFSLDTTHTL